MKRLYEAARALNHPQLHGEFGQSAMAVFLGESPQTLNNWEMRGMSQRGMKVAQQKMGCDANWLEHGEGKMTGNLVNLGPALVSMSIDSPLADLSKFQADIEFFAHNVTNLEGAERPVRPVRTPVVGTARMGENGYYDEIDYPVGYGDGWVDSYSSDPNAYALRVKGDSMHPAIRHGSFVVVEPNGRCVPGEYIVLALTDGAKMVKELVIERPTEIVIESVNGNHRKTIDRSEILKMHPVVAIVSASRWREN